MKAIAVNKIEQSTPNLMDLILGHKIDLVIDTPPQGAEHSKDGFVIRRSAIETGVNVLTAIDTAKALNHQSGEYRYSETDTGGHCKDSGSIGILESRKYHEMRVVLKKAAMAHKMCRGCLVYKVKQSLRM